MMIVVVMAVLLFEYYAKILTVNHYCLVLCVFKSSRVENASIQVQMEHHRKDKPQNVVWAVVIRGFSQLRTSLASRCRL
jgi:hypothetical protein